MSKSINVKNIRLAECTIKTEPNGEKTFTYKDPELVLGAMKVSMVPTAAEGELYEDGKLSEKLSRVSGYELGIDFGRLPKKWQAWLNGLTYESGVMSDDGECSPKPFAIGWEVEYILNKNTYKEAYWFLSCLAKPIEKNFEELKKDITIGNDTINITAFKEESFNNRAYVNIDTADKEVTEEMYTNFFTKVQTTRTISAKE